MLRRCAKSPKLRGVETVWIIARGLIRPRVCAERETSHRLVSFKEHMSGRGNIEQGWVALKQLFYLLEETCRRHYPIPVTSLC